MDDYPTLMLVLGILITIGGGLAALYYALGWMMVLIFKYLLERYRGTDHG